MCSSSAEVIILPKVDTPLLKLPLVLPMKYCPFVATPWKISNSLYHSSVVGSQLTCTPVKLVNEPLTKSQPLPVHKFISPLVSLPLKIDNLLQAIPPFLEQLHLSALRLPEDEPSVVDREEIEFMSEPQRTTVAGTKVILKPSSKPYKDIDHTICGPNVTTRPLPVEFIPVLKRF